MTACCLRRNMRPEISFIAIGDGYGDADGYYFDNALRPAGGLVIGEKPPYGMGTLHYRYYLKIIPNIYLKSTDMNWFLRMIGIVCFVGCYRVLLGHEYGYDPTRRGWRDRRCGFSTHYVQQYIDVGLLSSAIHNENSVRIYCAGQHMAAVILLTVMEIMDLIVISE